MTGPNIGCVLPKIHLREVFGETYKSLSFHILDTEYENTFYFAFQFCPLGGDFLEDILKIIHVTQCFQH
jgi:hypothetical protein